MSEPGPLGPPVVFRVAEDEAGKRIDKVVSRHLGALGRRAATDLFRRGAVHIGGKIAKKGDRARSGDEVRIGALAAEISAEPDAPLDVRFEATDLVVVNKPAGQPTAPIRPGDAGTLAAALLGRFPEMSGVGHRAREPGLLHRLDTQTSGLVVAARSSEAFARLSAALSVGRIEKKYLAVVEAAGIAASGVINRPLAPDPNDSRRVMVAPTGARRSTAAVTRFQVVRVNDPWALLEVSVSHAYRHQVRVHLASEGRPIAGDALYGGAPSHELGARHALHASYVAWAGDNLVPGFAVDCALPADLVALVGVG